VLFTRECLDAPEVAGLGEVEGGQKVRRPELEAERLALAQLMQLQPPRYWSGVLLTHQTTSLAHFHLRSRRSEEPAHQPIRRCSYLVCLHSGHADRQDQ
jgi:hypothetical protein